MKFELYNCNSIKVSLGTTEMAYLNRCSESLSIPLTAFGGLCSASPYVIIRTEKLIDMLNSNLSIEQVMKSLNVDEYVDKLEGLPQIGKSIVRNKVIKTINEKIPSGLFVKK